MVMTIPKECLRFQAMFSAWSDHELDPETTSMLKSHVNSCAECSSEWEAFQKTLEWLNAVEPVPAPSDIIVGIHEKLGRKSLFSRLVERLRQAQPLNLSLSAAAVTIVVALLTMTLMKVNFRGPANNHNPVLPGKIVVAENTHSAEISEDVPASSQASTATDRNTESSQPVGHPEVSPHPVFERRLAETPFHGHTLATVESLASSAGIRHEAGVDFVSLGPDRNSREKHSLKADPHYGHRLSLPPGVNSEKQLTPDIMVTVNAGDPEQYAGLFHELMDSEKWQARLLKDNVLLIILKPEELSGLQQILTLRDAVFSPAEVQTGNFRTPKKMLMVTVRLQ